MGVGAIGLKTNSTDEKMAGIGGRMFATDGKTDVTAAKTGGIAGGSGGLGAAGRALGSRLRGSGVNARHPRAWSYGSGQVDPDFLRLPATTATSA